MKAVRKLATACLAFSAAVFASNYILPVTWLPPGAVLCAALGVGLVFMRRKWLRGLIISLLAFSAGLLCFYGHYQRTSLPASRLDGVTAEVSGRLLEYPQVYEDYCRARIALQTEGMPRLDAVVYDSGGTLQDGVPGQTLSFTARITPADRRYGEPYDYYNAKDIYLTLNTRSDVVFSGEGGGLSTLPVRLARLITDKIREICPEDTAEFTVSLLLGDKSRLYEQEGLYLALSRAGLMHVVAVSGMHIAFLVSLLQLLLGRTRRSSLFCIALVWLFVLTAGASPSAVRAGVMQSLLLLAPVLDRENDAVTSLSFALGLLLLTNPYAAASVSLQLSFAAMAGLYGLSGRISAALLAALPEGRARTFLRRPVEIVGSSLSVMAFTVPLTALHFGTVSVLAPLTNCLCLWLVSICFCGGILSCALAALFPAAGICAAWLLAWPARAIFLASRLISALPFATLYMQDHFVAWWLLLCGRPFQDPAAGAALRRGFGRQPGGYEAQLCRRAGRDLCAGCGAGAVHQRLFRGPDLADRLRRPEHGGQRGRDCRGLSDQPGAALRGRPAADSSPRRPRQRRHHADGDGGSKAAVHTGQLQR